MHWQEDRYMNNYPHDEILYSTKNKQSATIHNNIDDLKSYQGMKKGKLQKKVERK